MRVGTGALLRDLIELNLSHSDELRYRLAWGSELTHTHDCGADACYAPRWSRFSIADCEIVCREAGTPETAFSCGAERLGSQSDQRDLAGERFETWDGLLHRNCEKAIDREVEKLLKMDSGWLIFNTHGLDEEGWGPNRASYLEQLLERLLAIESVEVLPAGKALARVAAQPES